MLLQLSANHHTVALLYFVLVIKIGVVQVSAISHIQSLVAVSDFINGIVILNHFHLFDLGNRASHID